MMDEHAISEALERWIKNFDGNADDLANLCNAFNLIKCQQTEIDILIRKKESLRNEICELQSEIERLKEFEYMYDSLLK